MMVEDIGYAVFRRTGLNMARDFMAGHGRAETVESDMAVCMGNPFAGMADADAPGFPFGWRTSLPWPSVHLAFFKEPDLDRA